jgi:hypothetical protein
MGGAGGGGALLVGTCVLLLVFASADLVRASASATRDLLGLGGTGGGGKGRVANLFPEVTAGGTPADVDKTCPCDTNITHLFITLHITNCTSRCNITSQNTHEHLLLRCQ